MITTEPKAVYSGVTPCGNKVSFDYPANLPAPSLAVVRWSKEEQRWNVHYRGSSVNAAASRLRWINVYWKKQHPEESCNAIVITVSRDESC